MNWNGYEPKEKLYESAFVDLNGKPVERTPFSNPYDYDDYVIWKAEDFDAENYSAVYSDRLMSWDFVIFSINQLMEGFIRKYPQKKQSNKIIQSLNRHIFGPIFVRIADAF